MLEEVKKAIAILCECNSDAEQARTKANNILGNLRTTLKYGKKKQAGTMIWRMKLWKSLSETEQKSEHKKRITAQKQETSEHKEHAVDPIFGSVEKPRKINQSWLWTR